MTLQERIDKRQQHECLRKSRYGSKGDARKVCGRVAQRGERIAPYHCRWCNRWHVGHRPPAHVITKLRQLPQEG